jgi:hypothetical protein
MAPSNGRLVDKLPPPPKPTQMKSICPGAPRSGSSSLALALKMLGFKPFAGMAHNFFVDDRFAIWTEAIQCKSSSSKGKPYTAKDYDKFLYPYDSISGWQAAVLAEELISAYPDANVILTIRDPDEWVESYFGAIVDNHMMWRRWRWMLPLVGGKIRAFLLLSEAAFPAFSNGDPLNKAQMREFYVQHNARVRELVPSERLLEYHPRDGWGPLCEFVGAEVPKDTPFPRPAEREQMLATMDRIWWMAAMQAAKNVAIGVGGAAIVVGCAVSYWQSGSFVPGALLQLPKSVRWSA